MADGNQEEMQNLDDQRDTIIHQPIQQDMNIIRIFKIHNKEYKYEGITNKKIEKLLKILEQIELCENQQNQTFQKIISMFNSIDDRLLQKCPFIKNKLKIDIYLLSIIVIYGCVYFFMLFESINLQQEQAVQKDPQIQEMVHHIPYLILLYTIFLLIQQQINNKIIWLILCIVQFIVPLFVLLDYYFNLFGTYSTTTQNPIGIAICITSFMILCNSIINKILLYYSERIFNKLISTIFICCQHILGSYLIVFQVIYLVISNCEGDYQAIFYNTLSKTGVPFILLLFLQSIIFIKGLFMPQPHRLLEDLNFLAKGKINNIFFFREDDAIVLEKLHNCYGAFQYYLVGYLVWQIYIFSCLMQEIWQSKINYEFVIGYLSFLVSFHIFIFFGLVIQQLNISFENLQFWIPIITNLFSIICVIISSSLLQNQYTRTISLLIGVLPSIVGIIWIQVIRFRSDYIPQDIQKIILSFFLVYPLMIYLTLPKLAEDSSIIYLLYIGLGFFGSVIYLKLYAFCQFIDLFMQYYKQKSIETKDALYKQLKKVDCSDFFQYFSSNFQIISFQILFYLILNKSQTATSGEYAMLLGSLITNTIQFILNQKVSQFIDSDIKLRQQYSIQRKIISIFSILSFIIFLFLSFIIQNQVSKITFLWCALLMPFIFQNYKFQLSIKITFNYFAGFIQPLFGIISQVIIIILTQIFPILFYLYNNNTEEYKKLLNNFSYYFILLKYFMLTLYAFYFQQQYQNNLKTKKIKEKLLLLLAQDQLFLSKKVATFLVKRIISDKNFDISQIEDKQTLKIIQLSTYEQKIFFNILMNQDQIDHLQCKSFLDQLKARFFNFLVLIFCFEIKSSQSFISGQLQPLNLVNEEKEEIIKQLLIFDKQYQMNPFNLQQTLQQDKRVAKLFLLYIYTRIYDEQCQLDFFMKINNNDDRQFFREKEQFLSDNQSFINFLTIIEGKQNNNVMDDDHLQFLATSQYQLFNEYFPLLECQFQQIYDITLLDIVVSEFYEPESNNKLNYWMLFIKQENSREKNFNSHSNIFQEKKNDKFQTFCKSLNYAICKLPTDCSRKWLKIKQEINIHQDILKQPKTEIIPLKNEDCQDLFKMINNAIIIISSENQVNQAQLLIQKISFTLSNVLVIIFIIYDYFQLALVCFFNLLHPQIKNGDILNQLKAQLLMDWNIFPIEFKYLLVLAILITLLYILLGFMAMRSGNRLGLNPNNQAATYKNGTFWLSKIIMVLNTQFVFVMRTFIRSFKCDYSAFPYQFAADPTIECFSQDHFLYLSLSIVFGSLFYIIATQIYPILQLNDKSIDIKFNPTYIIFFIQVRLIFLCITLAEDEISPIVFGFLAIYFLVLSLILFRSGLIQNKIVEGILYIIFELFFIAFMNKYIGGNAGWWCLFSQIMLYIIILLISKFTNCCKEQARQTQVYPQDQ